MVSTSNSASDNDGSFRHPPADGVRVVHTGGGIPDGVNGLASDDLLRLLSRLVERSSSSIDESLRRQFDRLLVALSSDSSDVVAGAVFDKLSSLSVSSSASDEFSASQGVAVVLARPSLKSVSVVGSSLHRLLSAAGFTVPKSCVSLSQVDKSRRGQFRSWLAANDFVAELVCSSGSSTISFVSGAVVGSPSLVSYAGDFGSTVVIGSFSVLVSSTFSGTRFDNLVFD